MAEILRMPEIAANTSEALLTGWLVAPNTPYAAGDALVTVETEKASVDVQAEADGVLLRVLIPEGRQVEVGTPIAVWGTVGEPDDDVDALVAALGAAPGTAQAAAAGTAPGTAQVAGAGTAAGGNAQSVGANGVDVRAVGSDPALLDVPSGPGRQAAHTDRRLFGSPLARRMAREAGIDLADLVGTGPNGRIRRRDVEAHLARPTAAPSVSPGRPPLRPAPAPFDPVASGVGPGQAAAFVDVPVSRMRQAIARRLTQSKQTAPHFYLRGTARVERLMTLRREINDGLGEGTDAVSVTDLLVKAVARAHTLVPALNVQWNGDTIRHFEAVDIAVAVATDTGLVTPVVRDVETMTLRRLARVTRDVASRARQKAIEPSELDGGSITVTNLGMYGTEEFAAIINPPQAAILAVGAARQEPVVDGGVVTVGTVLHVTLAVDHRPVDGADAAEWMRTFLGLIERPIQILA